MLSNQGEREPLLKKYQVTLSESPDDVLIEIRQSHSQEEDTKDILSLSNELIFHIIGFLSLKDMHQLTQTNKLINNIIRECPVMMEHIDRQTGIRSLIPAYEIANPGASGNKVATFSELHGKCSLFFPKMKRMEKLKNDFSQTRLKGNEAFSRFLPGFLLAFAGALSFIAMIPRIKNPGEHLTTTEAYIIAFSIVTAALLLGMSTGLYCGNRTERINKEIRELQIETDKEPRLQAVYKSLKK